jgi:hypothetical protein
MITRYLYLHCLSFDVDIYMYGDSHFKYTYDTRHITHDTRHITHDTRHMHHNACMREAAGHARSLFVS